MGNNVDDKMTPTFDQDQASKTGVDARTVRRDAERGEKIAKEVLDMITGTHHYRGAYQDIRQANCQVLAIWVQQPSTPSQPISQTIILLQLAKVFPRVEGSPEGGISAAAANAAMGNDNATAILAFASDTAQSSGKSLRAVQVAAQRGRELGRVVMLDRIRAKIRASVAPR